MLVASVIFCAASDVCVCSRVMCRVVRRKIPTSSEPCLVYTRVYYSRPTARCECGFGLIQCQSVRAVGGATCRNSWKNVVNNSATERYREPEHGDAIHDELILHVKAFVATVGLGALWGRPVASVFV